MQRAGAGIRSLAEPFPDTTSDFAEIIFAILGVAAKLECRRILERTARGRADAKEKGVKFGRKPILTPAPAERGPQAPRSGRDAAQRRAQLQCQPDYDFTADGIEKALHKTESASQFLSLYSIGKRDVEFLIKE
jgi:DNA invertase Pin-like site-specific DNA recombinase